LGHRGTVKVNETGVGNDDLCHKVVSLCAVLLVDWSTSKDALDGLVGAVKVVFETLGEGFHGPALAGCFFPELGTRRLWGVVNTVL
jgi:hypothetical protein